MREIPLTRGMVALVDDGDFDWVMSLGSWHAYAPCKRAGHSYWYAYHSAYRNGASENVAMHRFVLGAPKGLLVDHINGDGLDNRRSNLRLCTRSENARNRRKRVPASSRFLGVYRHKLASSFGPDRWAAVIGKQHLGMFATQEEAALAYDKAARETYGDFAALNFPEVAA